MLAPSYTQEKGFEIEAESIPDRFSNEPTHRFTESDERKAFHSALDRVRGKFGESYPLFIGGREQETGRYIDSINPAQPEELVGKVSCAGIAEADLAVQAAVGAFPGWSVAPVEERAGLLRKVAILLRQRRDEFASWEVYEAGKPWPEADADVTEAIDFLEYYANEAERLAAGKIMDVAGETNRYAYLPRGVGIILPPWNFPLAIVTGMLSAAVVSGNTVILKPSSQTPVVAAHFINLLREVGFPEGVIFAGAWF